jgi:pimeloyl-ACP methyl ester carboxylesterase
VVADRSRLVPISCGRVFVVDRGPIHGSALPLVFLHGLAVTHHVFRHVLPALAVDRRVVAIDLPGAGESDRPAPEDADGYALPWLAARVGEVLDALAVPGCSIVAHSLGGTVALELAASTRRVDRLVLVAPVVLPLPLPPEGRLALMPMVGPWMFRNLYRRADLRRYLARSVSSPEFLEESAVDVYWDRLGRDGGRAATYAMLEQVGRLGALVERLPSIENETLVVWGDRDALVPREHGEQIVARMPRARLEVVDGCGHSVPEERPERLVDLVRGELLGGPRNAPAR